MRVQQCWRRCAGLHHQTVMGLGGAHACGLQFVAQIAQAVALLGADEAHPADDGGRRGERRHHSKRGHQIAHVDHVDVETAQRAFTGDRGTGGVLHDLATHLGQHVHELCIALQGLGGEPSHVHRATGHRCGSERIAGRTGIGLDDVVGGPVATGRHHHQVVTHLHPGHTERRHHRRRDAHIRTRHQRGGHLQQQSAGQVRADQHEGGDVLAAHITTDGQRPGTGTAQWTTHAHWQLPRLAQRPNRCAERHKRLVQRSHRPAPQRGLAVDDDLAATQRRQRRHEPRRGTSQTRLQRDGAGREHATGAIDRHHVVGGVGERAADPEPSEAVEHRRRVVARRDAVQHRTPLGQRGTHQGPVGDALRTRHPNLGGKRPIERLDAVRGHANRCTAGR